MLTALQKLQLEKQLYLENEIKMLERKQFGDEEDLKALQNCKQKLDEVLTYKAEEALRLLVGFTMNWDIRQVNSRHSNSAKHSQAR